MLKIWMKLLIKLLKLKLLLKKNNFLLNYKVYNKFVNFIKNIKRAKKKFIIYIMARIKKLLTYMKY